LNRPAESTCFTHDIHWQEATQEHCPYRNEPNYTLLLLEHHMKCDNSQSRQRGKIRLTACDFPGRQLLLCQRLDVVGREEAHLVVDLALPPFAILLVQYGDDTALVEAELI